MSLLKQQLKNLFFKILFYSGVLRGLANCTRLFRVLPQHKNQKGLFPVQIKRRHSRTIQVLAYHRVTDVKDSFFSPVSTKNFDRQMGFLVEKCRVISTEECFERMKSRDIPPNCVVVTLDDGYRDNFTDAFPILRKYSIPATIYVATGCIDENKILWHDQVCSAFNRTQQSSLDLVDFNGKSYGLLTPREKEKALTGVLWRLREIPNEERIRWTKVVLERLGFQDCSFKSRDEPLMLSWKELAALRDGGISLGAHTVTHPILTQTSLAEARQEILDSKSDLESTLQVPVKTFAYPSGRREDINDAIKRIVKDVGFLGAFSMIYGVNEYQEDPFELRRIPVGNWDVPYFFKELVMAQC